jgi:hypothetical protein
LTCGIAEERTVNEVTTKKIGGHIKEATIVLRKIIIRKIPKDGTKGTDPNRANSHRSVGREAMKPEVRSRGKVSDDLLLERGRTPLRDITSTIINVQGNRTENWPEADTTKLFRDIPGDRVEWLKERVILSEEESMSSIDQGRRTRGDERVMTGTQGTGPFVDRIGNIGTAQGAFVRRGTLVTTDKSHIHIGNM